jgi:hypothetical protein
MSLSNVLALLSASHLNAAHPLAVSDNNSLDAQQTIAV